MQTTNQQLAQYVKAAAARDAGIRKVAASPRLKKAGVVDAAVSGLGAGLGATQVKQAGIGDAIMSGAGAALPGALLGASGGALTAAFSDPDKEGKRPWLRNTLGGAALGGVAGGVMGGLNSALAYGNEQSQQLDQYAAKDRQAQQSQAAQAHQAELLQQSQLAEQARQAARGAAAPTLSAGFKLPVAGSAAATGRGPVKAQIPIWERADMEQHKLLKEMWREMKKTYQHPYILAPKEKLRQFERLQAITNAPVYDD